MSKQADPQCELGRMAKAFAGYDPALQAVMGYMDITGDPDGPPMLCGVPFVDLKAGDALVIRERSC